MENNKINIAEILKDCPKGTKLYSPLFGEVKLKQVDSNAIHPIRITTNKGEETSFNSVGRYSATYPEAECMLFPSRKMRDWTKFFKRGDVVQNKDGGMYAIFEGWANDDYTKFNSTICFHVFDASFGEEEVCDTDCFVKAREEERAAFIADAEKHYNGKYNPDTLRVEPVKPECPFMPFDKVLVRDDDEKKWRASLFAYYDENAKYPYVCIPYVHTQCIPYNEHTAHLLGTTDPYTEGGSE
ncbi:hypothetical protein [uncultured Prevotella sp.]|uniref:hypothetical protein n=1 Tax=uncultured Prevotella sp. TaxID=159272 RepID=UPI0025FDE991|nr:hypothetical protein [uncultured Prevotella sp.]